MKVKFTILVVIILALGFLIPVLSQADEVASWCEYDPNVQDCYGPRQSDCWCQIYIFPKPK